MGFEKFLNKTFPLREISNIRLFYILTACNSAWFIAGNWIFYWTRFMTYGQLGLMDATCFLFGLLMEIPSGAIADMIGKRKTIIAGMGLSAVSVLTMSLANNMETLWIAFLVAQLGWALYSGAAEALAYDTLVDEGQESRFDEVITANGMVSTFSSVTATLVGGVAYAWHYRGSHFIWGLTYLLAFIISFYLREPKTDTEHFEIKKWWQTIVTGSKQLLQPSLKPLMVVILVLMGSEYLYEWGLIKPAVAVNFGFFDKAQALIFAGLGIISGLTVRLLPKIRNLIEDTNGLYWLTAIMGIGFMIMSLPLGYGGILPMLVVGVAGYLVYPWISIIINRDIIPKYRATTLSTVALLTKVPYVMVAIIAGKMVEQGQLWLFNLILGIVILMSIGISTLIMKRN